MTGSVENNRGLIQNNQSSLPAADQVTDTTDTSRVGLGYSADSTSEVVESVSITEEGTDLEEPIGSNQDESENLQRAVIDRQITGLRRVVSYFNSQFDIDSLDMADTASVLLLVKGMVSDMRALVGTEKISIALGSLQTRLAGHLSASESLAAYEDTQSAKKDNETILAEKQAELEDKEETLTSKKEELADITDSSDTSELATEIETLTEAVATLKSETTELEKTLTELNAALSEMDDGIPLHKQKLNTELSNDIGEAFSISQQIRQRFDSSALKTGEKQRAVTAAINLDDDKVHATRKQQFRAEKQALYDEGKIQAEKQTETSPMILSSDDLAFVFAQTRLSDTSRLLAVLDNMQVDHDQLERFNNDPRVDKQALLATIKVLDSILSLTDSEDLTAKEQQPLEQAVEEPQLRVQEAHKKTNDVVGVESENINPSFTVMTATTDDKARFSATEKLTGDKVDSIADESTLRVPVPPQVPALKTEKPPVMPVVALSDVLKQLEMLHLESEALNLVIEAEKERLATEAEISKPVPGLIVSWSKQNPLRTMAGGFCFKRVSTTCF